MSDFIITSSSTADLSAEQFKAIGVPCIFSHYNLNGQSYPDDLGQTIPFDRFYKMMEEGAETSTFMINTDEFTEFFTEYLEKGLDILHVELSSGISGVYGCACAAAEPLREKYPERKILVVDSLGASSGYGLLVYTLASLRDKGMSIDELYAWAEANKRKVHHWFFSTDLKYFVRGGRVTKTAGFVGTLLNICPMLNVDHQGRLIPRDKIRTKKRAIVDIVNRMEAHAENGLDYDGDCFISNSGCPDDANAVAKLIEERFKNLAGKVIVNSIGTTIGSHTGPGTVALFFFGDERVD